VTPTATEPTTQTPTGPSSGSTGAVAEAPEGPKVGASADRAPLAITVLADRVLVQVGDPEGERRSRAGILIPATAQVSRRLAWAEAVAVGPHVRSLKVGDRVLFNPEDRFEVEVQGEEYVILRERDIHAVAATRIDGGTGLYL
jgi:chaperonin GroES